jgi:hypothetical protein
MYNSELNNNVLLKKIDDPSQMAQEANSLIFYGKRRKAKRQQLLKYFQVQ